MGCATFTPLKVVARRERAARALGAAARGARIATGATMAAMITAVLLDVIHIRRFPELFPRRIFCRAQPLPKNKIRDCSPIRSRQRTHAVRRESALRLVRQSQNLPTRLASCHTNRNAEGPTGERFGNRRFASIHRWIRSVGRVGPRPRFCQTEAHRAFQTPWRGSWCACAARGPWLAMGVLAFGDPSTWASKVESEASRARASSRADAGRVSGERQQSHRHRVVSLRGGGGGGSASPGASSARGARGGPTAPTSPSIPSDPNFAPRAAWPEGTFTITYPRGYDPERRRFVDGDATNVTVEKLPAAKRAALEAERKAREEAAARAAKAAEEAAEEASRAAAEALNLDADYLERARRLRERAAARRKRPRGSAPSAPERPASATGRAEKSAPSTTTTVAVLATLGVDEEYAARARERDDARRRAKAARKAKAAAEAAKAKARETFDGDEEMVAYAARYAERAIERAEQRVRVAAARAEAAKATAAIESPTRGR